jgi:hypothetical protein
MVLKRISLMMIGLPKSGKFVVLSDARAEHNMLCHSSLHPATHDFCSYFGALQGTMDLRLTLEFLAVQASPLNPACDLPAEES